MPNTCSDMLPFVIEIRTLVINVSSNIARRDSMSERLLQKGISYTFVEAIESKDITLTDSRFLTSTAEAVWKSHLKCLSIAAEYSSPTLILEDDAVLYFDEKSLREMVDTMLSKNLDFIQLGYLGINLAERLSIKVRNLYSFFTRNAFLSTFFTVFGFKEVQRARSQSWRKMLPPNFVVNDVRFGAHCYLVTPQFAKKILLLNSPAFLPADDFFVSLSRAKAFKMIRLKKSCSAQDNSPSAFSTRFLLQ
jgi:GR25 family glycosyltransferase involved in LPS biosynthesis